MSNFIIISFIISIHSRVVHLSHLKEMSAIFSITTDINDITISLTQRASGWVTHGNQLCQWNQCNNSFLLLTFFFSVMISIHSCMVHFSHLNKMSSIFSITTDNNHIISFIQRARGWAPHGNQLCQWNQ